MELDSLKAILLKKSEGNNNLQTLIKYMGTEHLLSHVVDALEKMARPTSQTGKNANGPVTTFGANLDKSDVMQLRDALSHHVSHYKAALKAHHAATDPGEKQKMRGVADQHLNHLLPLMHLAARAGAHSGGKLALDYVKLPAWESNYTTLDRRPETGKFKIDTEKLGRRPAPGAKKWHQDAPHQRGVPDYHYLEMAPHHGHDDHGKMPHRGGYPWEEVQVGSSADIDAKKAYLHIEDVPDKKDYAPHPFDKHPVREVQDVQASHLTPERLQKFASDLAAWKGSDHHKQWLADQRTKMQADPEGYKKRGTVKPAHIYEGMPLKEQLGHVLAHPKPEVSSEAQSEAPATPASTAEPAAETKAVAPTVRKQSPKNAEMEELHAAYQKASPAVKNLFHQNTAFMNYLASKQGK